MSERRIKILFAINDLGIGGAQNMVIEQVQAIDPNIFDPHLLTLYASRIPNFESKVRLSPDKRAAFSYRGFFDFKTFFRIYRYLKREQFDAVITNLFMTNLIVRPLAALAGINVILAYEHNVYRNKNLWQKIADTFWAPLTFRILTGAPQVRAFTLAQEHLPEEKVIVVYDAAELVFSKVKLNRNSVLQKHNLPHNKLSIVACGRLTEQKGHEQFIDAAKIILDSNPEVSSAVQFLIFGEGEREDELAIRIADNNLQNHVRMIGMAPMADILAISDIFSLISNWEGFSIALIQAMNAGCAIVASRVSGSVDAIDDGVQGLLVPPYDAPAAAEAFKQLINDAALRARIGVAAMQKSQLFDITDQVKKIGQIVQSGLHSS